MPFTFSHPAAVIPLAKNPCLVFSALIIGSMTPDFESFLHLSTNVTFSHSLPGLLIFCLPSGTLIFLLFHLFLKRPLLSLAPHSHQQCLLPLVREIQLRSFRRWASILLSLTLGAMTHLLWDAATHEYGWIVQRITFLQATALTIGARSFRIYTLLQHGGTLVGGMILVYCYWRWYKGTDPGELQQYSSELNRDLAGVKPLSGLSGGSMSLNSALTAQISHFSERQKLGIASAIICSGGFVGILYATIRLTTEQQGAHFLKDAVLLGIPCILIGVMIFSGYAVFVAEKAPKSLLVNPHRREGV